MKKYSTSLFDLDGTLTDSSQGIINSIIYALEKYDITAFRVILPICCSRTERETR